MKLIKSEIKMTKPFNVFKGHGFRGIGHFNKIVSDLGLKLNPVDVEGMDYWKNDEATMVFTVEKENVILVKDMAKIVTADECDYEIIEDKLVFRLWWD